MSEQFTERDEQVKCEQTTDNAQGTAVKNEVCFQNDAPLDGNGMEMPDKPKTKLTKKGKIILIVSLVAVIGIAFALLYKPKIERVKDEAVQIAGMAQSGKDYFALDTYPDIYEDSDEAWVSLLLPGIQSDTLDAIKYANEALGFGGYLYPEMLETSALMGRQRAENDKYEVSWSYHPDSGLEVTYRKK